MLKLDIRSDEDARAIVEEIHRREGRLDVLVNNAGYGLFGAIEETTLLLESSVRSRQMLSDFFGESSLRGNRAQQAGKVLEVALDIRPSAGLLLGQKEVLDINEDGRVMIGTYTLHHERCA